MNLIKIILFFQILFLFCINSTYAQKQPSKENFYAIDTLKATKIESNKLFDLNRKNEIISVLTNQLNYSLNFILDTVVESKKSKHYLFTSFYKGIKIYNSTIKINVLNNRKINSFFYNAYPLPIIEQFPNFTSYNTLLPASDSIIKLSIEKVYFFTGEATIPSLKINYITTNWENIELILNEKNVIIYKKDCNVYYTNSTDTIVKAHVFFPDPLTSAKKNYELPYTDQNDTDVLELNEQRKQVNMQVTFKNDTFWLYNNYVKISEFSLPDLTPVAVSTLTTFNFTRAQSEFEDVNAYYHLNQYNSYLKNLGFTNLVNYQILVDTHALNGQDNSMFSPATTPPRLFFGEGGVDDAEDADVIIHEYGHAISHSAAPNTNNGTERKTLDEANGDYFAASYSKFLKEYNWFNVYSWDGHNEYWNGRFAASEKVYSNLSYPSIYTNTDIWSATLMQIENIIGRNTTQEIVLESMYSYADNISMADAAWLLVKSDSALNNGTNYPYICSIIKSRKFVNSCPVIDGIDKKKNSSENISILNTEGFYNGDCLTIISNNAIITSIEVTDAQGIEVFNQKCNLKKEELCSSSFSQGIYIIKISTNKSIHIQKLIKF